MAKRYRLTHAEYRKWRSFHADSDTSPVPVAHVPAILREMGIDATVNTLIRLPRDTGGEFPTGKPGRKPKWTPELIDLAAKILEEWGRFTPTAAKLMENGLTLRDYYQALEAAQKAVIEEYGEIALTVLRTPIDSDQYKEILTPPYLPLNEPASIEFELRDSVRELIEQAARKRG